MFLSEMKPNILDRWISLPVLTEILVVILSLIIVPLVNVLALFHRETHVWYVIPDEVRKKSLLKLYMEQMSLDEKKNISHFNDDELQKHALLTRTLVRTTLVRCRI